MAILILHWEKHFKTRIMTSTTGLGCAVVCIYHNGWLDTHAMTIQVFSILLKVGRTIMLGRVLAKNGQNGV